MPRRGHDMAALVRLRLEAAGSARIGLADMRMERAAAGGRVAGVVEVVVRSLRPRGSPAMVTGVPSSKRPTMARPAARGRRRSCRGVGEILLAGLEPADVLLELAEDEEAAERQARRDRWRAGR